MKRHLNKLHSGKVKEAQEKGLPVPGADHHQADSMKTSKKKNNLEKIIQTKLKAKSGVTPEVNKM